MAKPISNPGKGQAKGLKDENAFLAVTGAAQGATPDAGGPASEQEPASSQGILNSNGIDTGSNGADQSTPGNVNLPDTVSPGNQSPVIGQDPDGGTVLNAPRDNGIDPPVIGNPDGDPTPPVIIPGPTPPPLDVLLGTDGADVLIGTPGAEIIDGRGGNDVLVSTGGRDHLLGGDGDDYIVITHPNVGKISGGSGEDTLVLSQGLDLDLGAIAPRTDSIEKLDLSGGGANDVTLELADLLNMTDDGQLTIIGGPQDSIQADFSGHQVEHSFHAGYDIYTVDNGLAELIVKNTIDQEIVS